MYELQAFSPSTNRWIVTKLGFSERELVEFRRDRVNPAWNTRIVRVRWT